MKKKWFVLCIICLFFSLFYTFYHKEEAVSFITDVAIGKDNTVSFLRNCYDMSEVYELDEQNNIQNMFLIKPENDDTEIQSTHIVKDEQNNTYVLVQQQSQMQVIKQYVVKYDEKGIFQKTLFDCDTEQIEHKNHVLKNLQYIPEQNIIVCFLIEDNRTIHSLFYDTITEQSWKKTYYFDRDYTINEILYDGNDGVYITTPLSELYFIDKNNEISQIALSSHCVPYKLSIDEQNKQLYFNDIHHFCFVRYDIQHHTIETIYEENDIMIGDVPFHKVRDLKYDKGSFLASTPLYETEEIFFYIGTPQQSRTVFNMNKTSIMLFQCALKSFFAAIFCLGSILLLWHIWHHTKKILVRLVMIMVILLFVGSSCIGIALYKEIFEEMTDEVYMQLYSISTLIANNIDGDDLEQAVFPQKKGDYYYDTLAEKMYLDLTAFYEQNDNAMKKHLYYTLYFLEKDTFYVGVDSVNFQGKEELSNTNEKYITSAKEIQQKRECWQRGEAVFLMASDMTEQWLFTAAPIYNSKGELVGAFDVGLNEQDVIVYMSEMLIRTVVVILFAVMILMIVTTLFLKQFLKGVGKLKKCVDALTEGDWNVVAQIHSHDELEVIGNAFNKMTYRIKCFLDTILQMNTACERFLPTALFEKMGKENITELEIGDQVMLNVYILTIKVSNFYSITKEMTTEQKFKQINEILALISGVVGESNGIIESYQSAGMRVIYTEQAEFALDTALKIVEKIECYQRKTAKKLKLTMTLQYDNTMLGVVGNERHMAISLVSKSIDLIYHIEKYAEQNDMVLVMTKQVVEQIQKKQNYSIRKLVLPIENDITLFDCVNAYYSDEKEQRKQSLSEFIKGTQCCDAENFEQARKHFVTAISIAQNDVAAKKHIFYCDEVIAQKNKIILPRRKLVK